MGRWASRLTSLSPSVLMYKMGVERVKGGESEPRTVPGPDPPDVGGALAAFAISAVKCRRH